MSDDPAARLAALEQLDEDLFDFPDVEGMAELLATSRAAAASGRALTPSATSASNPARGAAPAAATRAVASEPAAPLPGTRTSAPKSAGAASAPPRNASDLDEDLFGFGELFELGGAPAVEAEAPRLDPRPPVAAKDDTRPAGAAPRSTNGAAAAPAAAAPVASESPVTVKPKERKPKETGAPAAAAAREKQTASPASSDVTPNAHATSAHRGELGHASAHAGAPFLSFPTSIDLPPARSKLLWVLVGCFLLANGGVFLLTQQQNQSVNQTLVAVTSTLAEAVARGTNAAPRERAPYDAPVDSAPGAAAALEPRLDSADFSNTNELGLHNARRLIEQGAYAEARRNLYFILANQDRSTPLTPALREDIDYLIALTYYDQGRSIAVEDAR